MHRCGFPDASVQRFRQASTPVHRRACGVPLRRRLRRARTATSRRNDAGVNVKHRTCRSRAARVPAPPVDSPTSHAHVPLRSARRRVAEPDSLARNSTPCSHHSNTAPSEASCEQLQLPLPRVAATSRRLPIKAEASIQTDPRTSCFYARRATRADRPLDLQGRRNAPPPVPGQPWRAAP